MGSQSPSMAGPSGAQIQSMFDRLAARYDRFNSVMSLGLDAYCRGLTLRSVRAGMRILDVGTGTGDLALDAARIVGSGGEAVGLDFSPDMLKIAAQKARAAGLEGRVRWVQRSAEDIPFEEAPYDGVVSGYVLRNIYEHIDSILAGIYKALKTGGWISFVDLTEPRNPVMRRLSYAYLESVTRLCGRLIFGSDYPDTYLRDSMKRFLKTDEFEALLTRTGFKNVRARPLMGGMVTHYFASK